MSNIFLKPGQLLFRPEYASQVMNWQSDEEHQEFQENLDAVDPYYVDNPIVYKHNSMGYRSQEISEIDGDFVLAMGCSITEGVALHYEDIWCTKLARLLDISVLNLGLAGAGMQAMVLNTLRYLENKYPLPKLVVVQHPERSRMIKAQFVSDEGKQRLHLTTDANYTRRTEELDWRDNNVTTFLHSYMYTDIITHLWNHAGVPVLHWTMNGDGEDFLSKYYVLEFPHDLDTTDELKFDLARDMAHSGRIVHDNVSLGLLPYVKDLLNSGALNIPAQLNRKRDLDKRSAYKHFVKKAIQIHKQEKPNE